MPCARRVLALKLRLYPGLTLEQVRVSPAAASAGVGREETAMAALAQDALTLISPSPEELRLRLPRGPQSGESILMLECWADCYPYRQLPELDLADTILRSYGPQGTGAVRPADVQTESFGDLQRWLDRTLGPEADQRVTQAVTRADWIVFALADYNPAGYPASGAVRRFLDAAPLDLRNKKLVALAFHVPYQLDATEIGKLTAYFAVYSKTPQARDVAIKALFREIQPRGASPVSIPGIGYDLAQVVQPDPGQTLALARAPRQPDGGAVTVVTGRILDRKGHPVPDGTEVTFTQQEGGLAVASQTAGTVDGSATATLPAPPNVTSVHARLGSLTAPPLTIMGRAASAPALTPEPARPNAETPATAPPDPAAPPTGAAGGTAALAGLLPAALALGGVLLGGGALVRRRAGRRPAARPEPVVLAVVAPEPAPPPPLPEPPALPEVSPPLALRIEPETRRVWVEGSEVRPPLSPEQYRLLAWLHQNAGRVCSREEIVTHVWPEAHAEGVSEEALDALVRRLRERLTQAGGSRRFIVTVRGHGLRLDA